MKAKKSFWASITGGLTSAAPIVLSCCKSGACVGVCASPIASLFGISSATLANSPLISALEPVLIAISAVSFTISYYSLYVLPKLNCNTTGDCACEPTAKEKRKVKINKAVFWIGLMLSIGFLSYFEISKYQAATAENTECSTTECAPGACSEESTAEESCTTSCDSASASCCEKEIEAVTELSIKSQITCPKCGHKKIETMPTDVCLLSYTCESCRVVLHPKESDCCVFCTYGDHKCPSMQPSSIENKNDQLMSCKLTNPELQKRKETVIAELKQKVLEKKELPNGFAFKFKGDDQTINKLNEFIKSERQCCDFFTFELSISGDKSNAWLKLTGSKDAKEFISTEMGL